MLAQQAAERLHDGHIADDVGHLAVDGRGAIGERMMQGFAGGGAAEHDDDDQPGDDHQARRHPPADGGRRSAMAQTVARQGGSTFHTSMFSTVKSALDVAVMRLVSVPGERLAK